MREPLRSIQALVWTCRRCDQDPRIEVRLRQQTLVFPDDTKLLVVATAPPHRHGTDRQIPALSVHSDPKDRLRGFLERTLGESWDELVTSGVAVLHAVKCAVVPKVRVPAQRERPDRSKVNAGIGAT